MAQSPRCLSWICLALAQAERQCTESQSNQEVLGTRRMAMCFRNHDASYKQPVNKGSHCEHYPCHTPPRNADFHLAFTPELVLALELGSAWFLSQLFHLRIVQTEPHSSTSLCLSFLICKLEVKIVLIPKSMKRLWIQSLTQCLTQTDEPIFTLSGVCRCCSLYS